MIDEKCVLEEKEELRAQIEQKDAIFFRYKMGVKKESGDYRVFVKNLQKKNVEEY